MSSKSWPEEGGGDRGKEKVRRKEGLEERRVGGEKDWRKELLEDRRFGGEKSRGKKGKEKDGQDEEKRGYGGRKRKKTALLVKVPK